MKRWLTARQAAEYCGYSVKTFKKYVREYNIPRYGPKKNRYCTDDLDQFMKNPHAFTIQLDLETKIKLIKSGIDVPLNREKGEFVPV